MSPNPIVVRHRSEQEIADGISRLRAAGLNAAAARKVARHPTWGPVVLGPGVIISLFETGEASAEAVA